MPIRKRPELDVVSPPGQITNPVGVAWPFPSSAHCEKPLQQHIQDFVEATEHNETEDKVVLMAEYFRGKSE